MRDNEYTMFKKSKPWGYYPPDVEKKIDQYEAALSQVNQKYLEQVQINNLKNQKISALEGELRDMHIQMSSLELPEPDEMVEHYVLDNFKNYNSAEANSYPVKIIKEGPDNNGSKNIYKNKKEDELCDDIGLELTNGDGAEFTILE